MCKHPPSRTGGRFVNIRLLSSWAIALIALIGSLLPYRLVVGRTQPGITTHTARRSNPWINSPRRINLRDARDLPSEYIGARGLSELLRQNLTTPTALTSADFDEDGVPDLVCGYIGPSGGMVTLHRGNVYSIYPNQPRPSPLSVVGGQLQRATDDGQRTKDAPPFLPYAQVFELAAAPDFLGAGDFDNDGHWDVVTAAQGSDRLYLMPGDGKGGFGAAKPIELPGRVTALVTGEINRADGLTDVVVGITGPDGPQVLVFEGPSGALKGQPEAFSLAAEATALALGQLDDNYEMDLAIAAGSELMIVHGRDRRLSLDEIRQAEVQSAVIEQRSFPFAIKSIALGDFIGDKQHQTDVALLADDGAIHILASPTQSTSEQSRQGRNVYSFGTIRDNIQPRQGRHVAPIGARGDFLGRDYNHDAPLELLVPTRSRSAGEAGRQREAPLQDWHSDVLTTGSWSTAAQLVRVKTSGLPTDDLVVIDGANHKLQIISGQRVNESTSQRVNDSLTHFPIDPLTAALDVSSAPVAVLPMRLNVDALDDLVILQEGSDEPTVALSAPAMTFTVTTTGDNGGVNPPPGAGTGTLRQAIVDANANPGADMITFNILPAGMKTISPMSALPTITDPVTIDGTTQPGFAGSPIIELNGTGAGDANGLLITAGSSIVRGLVINRFNNNGILLSGPNGSNQVEGNFIGMDATGTTPLANVDGVLIDGVPGNKIGGMVAAARNVISGNGLRGVDIQNAGATMNQVQGNFIGTDVTGTMRTSVVDFPPGGWRVHLRRAQQHDWGDGDRGTQPHLGQQLRRRVDPRRRGDDEPGARQLHRHGCHRDRRLDQLWEWRGHHRSQQHDWWNGGWGAQSDRHRSEYRGADEPDSR